MHRMTRGAAAKGWCATYSKVVSDGQFAITPARAVAPASEILFLLKLKKRVKAGTRARVVVVCCKVGVYGHTQTQNRHTHARTSTHKYTVQYLT